MNKGLQNYLNDHLAGSQGALKLVEHLIDTTKGEPGNGFFKGLKRTIKSDQQQLTEMMEVAGVKKRRLVKIAGNVAGGASRMRWRWEKDSTSNFEALEMLALGIQAKRLLWRILDEVSHHFPEWAKFNFIQLEKDALVQREAVESLRRESGREALAP
jgi:hypothetical protein